MNQHHSTTVDVQCMDVEDLSPAAQAEIFGALARSGQELISCLNEAEEITPIQAYEALEERARVDKNAAFRIMELQQEVW